MIRKKRTAFILVLLLLLALTACSGKEEKEESPASEDMVQQSQEDEDPKADEEINIDDGESWKELPGVSIAPDEYPRDGSISDPAADEGIVYVETESDSTYFDDALFIGDSRTVGLKEYGTLNNADYFATPGLSVYTIPKTRMAVGDEELSLEDFLEQKDYGKIYLMLGMNELGYDFSQTVERYRTFVEELLNSEPGVILYLCANMHVTITRSENDAIYNNASINRMNAEIENLAEEKELPYLDINVLFDDEQGNLNAEYASDDSHVLGRYYETWCEWLQSKTVIRNENSLG